MKRTTAPSPDPASSHRSAWIRRHRRSAVTAVLALAAVSALAYSHVATAPSAISLPAPSVSIVDFEIEPMTNTELAVALSRVCLDAQSLAAAGLSELQATALVGRARSHLAQNIQELRDADLAWAAAGQEKERLERLVRSGLGTQQDTAALAEAQVAYSAASTARRDVLADFASAALEGVGAGPGACLTMLRANTSRWNMPTKYLAESRTEDQWLALREALANDRISASLGQEPDQEAQQLLATINAATPVATAASNLSSNLPAVTTAWNTAVYQQ